MKRKSFIFLFSAFLTFGTSLPAKASHFVGFVTSIFVMSGKAFVHVTGGIFDGAMSPCSSATDNAYYMIDLSSNFGKSEYANSLASKLAGRRVYAVGDDTCNGNPYGPVGAEVMLGIDLTS